MTITKTGNNKNRLTDIENKPVVTSREKGEGRKDRGKGLKGTNYHVLNKITRIYYTTQGIQPICYNNSKQDITFKNCESLCCTLETYIILYLNYTSVPKKKERLVSS